MKTKEENAHLKVVVQQVNSNTTAWMGHRHKDGMDVIAGQTFICPSEGDLDAIEILPTLVIKAGHAQMTIHAFDPVAKKWGPVLHSSSIEIHKKDAEKWVAFPQTGLHLDKGGIYGFQLQSKDMFIGIAEAAGSHMQPPYSGGQEWIAYTDDKPGKYFSYLSLAFKVDLRA
jgi:hypothetical protein